MCIFHKISKDRGDSCVGVRAVPVVHPRFHQVVPFLLRLIFDLVRLVLTVSVLHNSLCALQAPRLAKL